MDAEHPRFVSCDEGFDLLAKPGDGIPGNFIRINVGRLLSCQLCVFIIMPQTQFLVSKQ